MSFVSSTFCDGLSGKVKKIDRVFDVEMTIGKMTRVTQAIDDCYVEIEGHKFPLRLTVDDVPVVCNFPDVFLEELPGLPPEREIDPYLVLDDLFCSFPCDSSFVWPIKSRFLDIPELALFEFLRENASNQREPLAPVPHWVPIIPPRKGYDAGKIPPLDTARIWAMPAFLHFPDWPKDRRQRVPQKDG
ncbi:hypothetical protein E3N88_32567 [Mikania micrantha]|uniref:Uncharacterized protein n=1 Tax=Mikania micrantha TaxID=192012 RepID=A0A5N6M9B8_9ASTR|nr:hypothetical protein E3N88_32567 [Mikania micrantha]